MEYYGQCAQDTQLTTGLTTQEAQERQTPSQGRCYTDHVTMTAHKVGGESRHLAFVGRRRALQMHPIRLHARTCAKVADKVLTSYTALWDGQSMAAHATKPEGGSLHDHDATAPPPHTHTQTSHTSSAPELLPCTVAVGALMVGL